MNLLKRKNAKGDKTYYYYDFGRGKGQRPATGIFVYTRPKDQTQKNHNKQALALLEVKKSQVIIEQQSIGTAYIPPHKFKENFLDYYEEYVSTYRRDGNRHLQNSLNQFRLFLNTKFISPVDITEVLCKNFRRYLLDKYTGETPSDYYTRIKWVSGCRSPDSVGTVPRLFLPLPLLFSNTSPSLKITSSTSLKKSVSINRPARYCPNCTNHFKSLFMHTQNLAKTLPDWHSKPFRLTKKEIANPLTVVKTFMADFPLPEIRKTLNDWLSRVLISNVPDPLNYIWFREELERFMEACYTSQERTVEPLSRSSDFIALLGHELQGQFAGINSTDMHKQPDGSFSDEATVYIDYIKMITLNAKTVYENMVASSLAGNGNLKILEEEMLIEPFIHSCIDSFSILSSLQNIRIDRDVFMPRGIKGVTDFVKLRQIFSNLLLNAFKNAQPESYIIARAHVYGEKMILKVINRGKTIPKEKLKLIFEPYQTLGQVNAGAGLGLYICKQYTDLLGGNIEVRSKKELTAFFVNLDKYGK
ncbi:ATP-binding protein [Chitinophaga sp.]|uniref:ATP-binding protein n=1 Tax=Chitinophaga sp. TaxID=1869181 RepID=UPI0031CF265F